VTKGDLTVGGTLGVTGNATFGNNLTVGGTLGVTSNATIDGTLGVSGTATFDNSVIVTGGSFDVDLNKGNVSLQSGKYGISFNDTGTMNIDGDDVTISGNVNIGGSAIVTDKIIGQSGIKVSRGGEIIGADFVPSGGTGLIVEGGQGVTGTNNSGGTGLIVRGGTCNTGSTGLGLKVERGGAEIYSGTGTSKDDNILKVKDNSVSISGNKGLLSAHKITADTAGIYERSNAGTDDKGITYTLEDMITGYEGNIHCGGISDITSGNSYRTLYNRSSLQAYNQKYDTDSGSQNYIGSQFFINPCGGKVYINQRVPKDDIEKSTSTTTGALIVNGGVGIKENLYIGEQLVINGTKISSDSTGLIIDKHTTVSSGATINGEVKINGNTTITDRLKVNKLIFNEISNITIPSGVSEINCFDSSSSYYWNSNTITLTIECNNGSSENRVLWLSKVISSTPTSTKTETIHPRVWYSVIVKIKNNSSSSKKQNIKISIDASNGKTKTYDLYSNDVESFSKTNDYDWAMFSCMLLTWNTLLLIPIDSNSMNVHILDKDE
jgi:hypothetical protein